MYKHFNFHDRVKLQYHLDTSPRIPVVELTRIIKKSRAAIYYELKHNIRTFDSAATNFIGADDYKCPHLSKFPFCCNGCAKTRCSHRCKEYDAYYANTKAHQLLKKSRTDTKSRKEVIEMLDKYLSQLIIDGQSINVAMLSVNRCDFS